MRCKFPDSLLSIQVKGFVEITESERWIENADGIPARTLRFEGSDGTHLVVNLTMPGDGYVQIDAPNLGIADSSMQGTFRALVLTPIPVRSKRRRPSVTSRHR